MLSDVLVQGLIQTQNVTGFLQSPAHFILLSETHQGAGVLGYWVGGGGIFWGRNPDPIPLKKNWKRYRVPLWKNWKRYPIFFGELKKIPHSFAEKLKKIPRPFELPKKIPHSFEELKKYTPFLWKKNWKRHPISLHNTFFYGTTPPPGHHPHFYI